MKKLITGALVLVGMGTVTWAIIHRRAIAAAVKGEPMPEPPEWHYSLGLHKKKA